MTQFIYINLYNINFNDTVYKFLSIKCHNLMKNDTIYKNQ